MAHPTRMKWDWGEAIMEELDDEDGDDESSTAAKSSKQIVEEREEIPVEVG